jgi:hypothetical protein
MREDTKETSLVSNLHPNAVLEKEVVNKALHGGKNFHTPTSDRVAEALREPLREFLSRKERYEVAFDEFEYLLGFKYMDLTDDDWMPVGAWGWRDPSRRLLDSLVEACKTQQNEWPPVREGLFRSPERFLELNERLREKILPHVRFG